MDRYLEELIDADGDIDKVDWTNMDKTFVEVLRSIDQKKRVDYLRKVIAVQGN